MIDVVLGMVWKFCRVSSSIKEIDLPASSTVGPKSALPSFLILFILQTGIENEDTQNHTSFEI